MKKTISALLLFSFPALADPGFYRPDETAIPAAVRNGLSGVFLIAHVQPRGEIVEAQDYPTKLLELQEKSERARGRIRMNELKRCIRSKTARCELERMAPVGTAFKVKDNRTLWTAAHVFYTTLFDEELKESFQEKDLVTPKFGEIPNFVLFDMNGRLVFEHRKMNKVVTLKRAGDPRQFPESLLNAPILGYSLTRMADFLELGFDADLPGNTLVVSETAPLDGDPLFLAGYPTETTNRPAGLAVTKRTRDQLRLAKGRQVDGLDCFERMRGEALSDRSLAKGMFDELETGLLFSDIDLVPGMSGGPILNARGEVVAIASSHYTTEENGSVSDHYYDCGAIGVRAQQLR